MPNRAGWTDQVRRDIARLSDDRPLPRRRGRRAAGVGDGVYLRWHYDSLPVLGALAWDADRFDLAIRRAAHATRERISIDEFFESDIRLPRADGLQLRGSEDGSLDLLVDIPVWIVAALASDPATALANLIAFLSQRERIRVRLRRLVLTPDESRILEEASRPPALPPAPEANDEAQAYHPLWASQVASDEPEEYVAPQGALPRKIAARLDETEPLVDVEVGHVHVRTRRPDIDIVIRDGDSVTSVSIREPQR